MQVILIVRRLYEILDSLIVVGQVEGIEFLKKIDKGQRVGRYLGESRFIKVIESYFKREGIINFVE